MEGIAHYNQPTTAYYNAPTRRQRGLAGVGANFAEDCGETAVVCATFSAAPYVRPRANLLIFLRDCRLRGIPVYLTEVLFKEPDTGAWQQPLLAASPRVVHRYSSSYLFHKEDALNAVVAGLPSRYKYVAWVDPDLHFENMNWLADTERLLQQHKVVQCFDYAVWTDQYLRETGMKPGTAKAKELSPAKAHPGFAWAARRELWTGHGGLYDAAVVGGGDMLAALAFYDRDIDSLGGMPRPCSNTREAIAHYNAWADGVRRWCQQQVGWVPGRAVHHWHGDRENRKYSTRQEFLHEFDPQRHLTHNAHGILEWTQETPPEIREGCRQYFIGRREDG